VTTSLYGTGRKLSQLPATRWLTPRWIAEWLVEEEVLEIVLGHPEVWMMVVVVVVIGGGGGERRR